MLRLQKLGLILTIGLPSVALASQKVFTLNSTGSGIYSGAKVYDEGLFNPIGDFSVLSDTNFTTLRHPEFPKYGVRIKKSSTFCDPTVKSYSGYIDIEARHLFFYFFESRNDPDKDDVILWTNGGPGASSALGLFMELGPCRILDEHGPKFHPESWNNNANLFFIDQPINVGYSYADYGEQVTTTEESAKDIAAFVAIFFEHFNKLKGRPFHMAGESYGGRYLPVYASEIYDQNPRLIEVGLTPINLVSVMIGNGYTDHATLSPSYYEMACTAASTAPVLSISTCMRMKQALPRCKKWLKESCVDTWDAINCGAAAAFCYNELEEPFFTTKINPYDITRECEGELTKTLCYPMTMHIGNFLDQPSVKKELGVDPALNYSSVSWFVNMAFSQSLDQFHPTHHYIAALLERGVKALIYVGANDWSCNWIGNQQWTMDLEWSGSDEFRSQELKSWTIDGQKAGLTRSAKGLTFITIDGAGHMVPYDKPKESLFLVKKWLSGESF
ncbi:serine carboxypeptidase [Panaeolus papilionaceus]|nr:serine carboxypeptidase [Panaeolus papilionaceus]